MSQLEILNKANFLQVQFLNLQHCSSDKSVLFPFTATSLTSLHLDQFNPSMLNVYLVHFRNHEPMTLTYQLCDQNRLNCFQKALLLQYYCLILENSFTFKVLGVNSGHKVNVKSFLSASPSSFTFP